MYFSSLQVDTKNIFFLIDEVQTHQTEKPKASKKKLFQEATAIYKQREKPCSNRGTSEEIDIKPFGWDTKM
jgi:hypothetical protein